MRSIPLRWCSLFLLLVFTQLLASPRAEKASHRDHPLLVAYFPQWGIYNQPQYLVKNLITSGSAPLVDQLNYAQGSPKDGRCSVADPNADLNLIFSAGDSVSGHADKPDSAFRGNFHQLLELKKRYPHIKVLISLEGSADSFAYDAKAENRKRFVSSCIDVFLRGRFAPGIHKAGIFDGIDVDWEYPKSDDAANYMELLREFRRQMDAYKPGLRLTVAVGPSPHMYPGVDMAQVGATVDEVGVMNYDYAGPWNKTTGIIAPLYKDPLNPRGGGSVDSTLHAYMDAGVAPRRLLMGLPFYGYGWKQVDAANHGLYQPGEPIHSDQPYTYVAALVAHSTTYRDPVSRAPWLFDGSNFWTYEDAASITYKVGYAEQQHLGGVMIWELSGDTTDGSLLRAAYSQLANPAPPEPPLLTASGIAEKGVSSTSAQ